MGEAPGRYRSRQRAHETEAVVARYLAEHGWPYAKPVGAGKGGRDVTGVPGVAVEVKSQRHLRLLSWLRQAASHRETAGELAAVVERPDGMGPASAGSWPVIMRLEDWVRLLHVAGYGEPEEEEASG